MKTIAIPEDLHKELINLKLELNDKNAAELIRKLVLSYKEKRFLEASNLFRKRLGEKNISFEDLLKKSKKIRGDIADEWWSDKA